MPSNWKFYLTLFLCSLFDALAWNLRSTRRLQQDLEEITFTNDGMYIYAVPRLRRSMLEWDEAEFVSILEEHLSIEWRGFARNIVLSNTERLGLEVLRNGTVQIQERLTGRAIIDVSLNSSFIEERLLSTTSLGITEDTFRLTNDPRLVWIYDIRVDGNRWQFTRESDPVVERASSDNSNSWLLLILLLVIVCALLILVLLLFVRQQQYKVKEPVKEKHKEEEQQQQVEIFDPRKPTKEMSITELVDMISVDDVSTLDGSPLYTRRIQVLASGCVIDDDSTIGGTSTVNNNSIDTSVYAKELTLRPIVSGYD